MSNDMETYIGIQTELMDDLFPKENVPLLNQEMTLDISFSEYMKDFSGGDRQKDKSYLFDLQKKFIKVLKDENSSQKQMNRKLALGHFLKGLKSVTL